MVNERTTMDKHTACGLKAPSTGTPQEGQI